MNRIIARPTARATFLGSKVPLARLSSCGLVAILLASLLTSCGGKTDTEPTSARPASGDVLSTKPASGATLLKKPAPADAGPKTPAGDLQGEMSRIINEAGIRYASMSHEYDEDLLNTIDQAEAYLSGRRKGPAPRAMPKLSEQEELDHLRETIRRWQAKTGKDLRAEIEPLKAEVAARKPGGPTYHPDFHKRFAAVFDTFIPIEVAEMRERRNRAIHQAAKPLFDKYRATAPDLVKQYEATLNAPPYNLPLEGIPEPAAKTSSPPKA